MSPVGRARPRESPAARTVVPAEYGGRHSTYFFTAKCNVPLSMMPSTLVGATLLWSCAGIACSKPVRTDGSPWPWMRACRRTAETATTRQHHSKKNALPGVARSSAEGQPQLEGGRRREADSKPSVAPAIYPHVSRTLVNQSHRRNIVRSSADLSRQVGGLVTPQSHQKRLVEPRAEPARALQREPAAPVRPVAARALPPRAHRPTARTPRGFLLNSDRPAALDRCP